MPSELELRPTKHLQLASGSQAIDADDAIVVSGSGPLPLIKDGEDLVPLLRQASNEELAPLVEYIVKKGGFTAQLQDTQRYKLNFSRDNHKAYADDISAEIQKFGGNTLWSHIFRKGHGKKYRKILKDVAKRCGVKTGLWDDTAEIENRVVLAVLGKAYEGMSERESRELLNTLEIHRVPGTPTVVGVAALQTAIQSSGFAPYKVAVIVANGMANSVLGHGLAFASNAGLVKGISVFAGPVGWALDGFVGSAIVAGPAYRVTIPCVVQVALIRKSMLQRKRARFRRIILALLAIAAGAVLALVLGRWLGLWFSTMH
jgi:uncharacterized protein YaaW (UPF0174 family)